MRNLLPGLLFLLCTISTNAQSDYEKAWQAINSNDWVNSSSLLAKAMKDPKTFVDAYITNLFLINYNGDKNADGVNFAKDFYDKVNNPYPYLYALWKNQSLLGDGGKKKFPHQVLLATKVANDIKAPGILRVSANYHLAYNQKLHNAFDRATDFIKAIRSVRNWQLTGPFENISESGIEKNYGPLDHPEPESIFRSITGADVKWINPVYENDDSWIPFNYSFGNLTAVTYAQTFINSPVDQELVCAVGFAGSIKVWVNDKLIIKEMKERLTDYDAYAAKCNLKKGTNRVLVQLGFTNNNYPNFVLRFTDNNFNPVDGLESSRQYLPYPNDNLVEPPVLIPHFAESFFEQRLASDSSNMLNYLLLSNAYMRSSKTEQARNVINLAIQRAPKNALLVIHYISILTGESNKTLIEEEKHHLKDLDPSGYPAIVLELYDLVKNDKYSEVSKKVSEYITLFGEDEMAFAFQASVLVKENKYDDIIKLVDRMYAKYPDNPDVQESMYNIKKQVIKDNTQALSVYEKYFANNYNPKVFKNYTQALLDAGKKEKYLEVFNRYMNLFPYSPEPTNELSNYYFTTKEYDKAEKYINKSLQLAPYNEYYWEILGDIKNQQNKTEDAVKAYSSALKYSPQKYSLIEKMRKYKGKQPIEKLFPQVDVNSLIAEDRIATKQENEYGYYFIHDQKDVVIYPEGANEAFVTILIKILNENGVDRYKEVTVGGDADYTTLIEKAEVIKEGSRTQGEKNGTSVVFTNLQPGDVVYVRYKLQNYAEGRFSKDFTDKYYFNSLFYCRKTIYNLLVPPNLKFNYKFSSAEIKPVIKDVEDFKSYTWQITNAPILKDEPLMPHTIDVANVLHISTIPEWQEVSSWYSDIVYNRIDADHDVKAIYAKLFSAGKTFSNQFAKAKYIYDYLMDNIRYSSVSFRQSGFVPQKASKTLNTRLGDCKDISTVFVTLAQLAGIEANLVLVNTRNNGTKSILLPELGFNHCIVKAKLDGKQYFIETTDMDLPFASVPADLNGAIMLEIPDKGTKNSMLDFIKAENKTPDKVIRFIEMRPNGNDINLKVRVVKTGGLTSAIRSEYKNLNKDDAFKRIKEMIARMYQSNTQLESVNFSGLHNLNDSAGYNFSYTLKDAISEIGSMYAFKVNYHDIIATLDKFTEETREYPFEYWNYEDADEYETDVVIYAPTGKTFVDLPNHENIKFNGMEYQINFKLEGSSKMVIKRKFSNDRPQQISPVDYESFKSFFEKIVKVEQKFITYK